jgi:hypothetical protein
MGYTEKRKTTNDKMNKTEVPRMDNQNKKTGNTVFTKQDNGSVQINMLTLQRKSYKG